MKRFIKSYKVFALFLSIAIALTMTINVVRAITPQEAELLIKLLDLNPRQTQLIRLVANPGTVSVSTVTNSPGVDNSSVRSTPSEVVTTYTPPAGISCYRFNRDLKQGDTGEDVVKLIGFLRAKGYLLTDETTFNTRVVNAVKAFQEGYPSEILSPHGITVGTGYVGNSTRSKMVQLLCGSSATVNPDNSTTGSTGGSTTTNQPPVREITNPPVSQNNTPQSPSGYTAPTPDTPPSGSTGSNTSSGGSGGTVSTVQPSTTCSGTLIWNGTSCVSGADYRVNVVVRSTGKASDNVSENFTANLTYPSIAKTITVVVACDETVQPISGIAKCWNAETFNVSGDTSKTMNFTLKNVGTANSNADLRLSAHDVNGKLINTFRAPFISSIYRPTETAGSGPNGTTCPTDQVWNGSGCIAKSSALPALKVQRIESKARNNAEGSETFVATLVYPELTKRISIVVSCDGNVTTLNGISRCGDSIGFTTNGETSRTFEFTIRNTTPNAQAFYVKLIGYDINNVEVGQRTMTNTIGPKTN